MDLAYKSSTSVAAPAASDLDLQQAGKALDDAVAADPQDLRAHLRRIHFHWQRQKGDQLFAGLVDLFLILGCHGLAIRSRLVRQSENLISAKQQVFLLQHLDAGLEPSVRLPTGTASVLRNAQPSDEHAGRRSDRASVAFQLAEEYVRLGWEDLGKALFKELIDEEPDNRAARLALVKLA